LACPVMIESIVPRAVAVGETWSDLDEPLFPEELSAILRAVDRRRAEFRSVRGCARIALAQLGLDRPPLVPDTAGAPTWPPGLVGSMTHCAGYRAAVVARTDEVVGIGIDAEPHVALPHGVLDTISSPDERDHLVRLAVERPDVRWDRLLFSAKESVYKTWYPLARVWLGFEGARLRFHPDDGTLVAELLHPGLDVEGRPITRLHGRWLLDRELVVTAVVLTVNMTA
jgi:4'-phosphopantetheinyl transferase EntD